MHYAFAFSIILVHFCSVTYGYTNTSLHENFRLISRAGIRDHNEGGIFYDISVVECGRLCIIDKKCLSFEFDVSRTCYISHTNQYEEPESFLVYDNSDYYEWHGNVSQPEFHPNGGNFTTNVMVTILSKSRDIVIHYNILDAFENILSNGTLQSHESIVLPSEPCSIIAYGEKQGMTPSSSSNSRLYAIAGSKYGYLVPFYNDGFHGKVVRVALDIKGKKRPRPARYHEFSDFNSPSGVGEYDGQLTVLDLALYRHDLRGFHAGFSGRTALLYWYHEPSSNSYNKNSTYNVRTSTNTWAIIRESLLLNNASLPENSSRLFYTEEFIYLVPYYDGTDFSGQLVRVRASTFADIVPDIEILNLAILDDELTGFSSGFSYENFIYLVPYKNNAGFSGKFVRIDAQQFTADSVQILDLTLTDTNLRGFSQSFVYENFAYLVPFQNDHDRLGDKTCHQRNDRYSGLIAKVNLDDFFTVEKFDLQSIGAEYVGFSGGFVVGHFGYFSPFMYKSTVPSQEYAPQNNQFSGLIIRLDLLSFTTVEILDLTTIDDSLRGFMGGFASGKYAIFVPHKNGIVDDKNRVHSGHIVRVDTQTFKKSGVQVLNAPKTIRAQIPSNPDNELRGFSGGFASGKYGFFVPQFHGAGFSGKLCRVTIDTWTELQVLDVSTSDGSLTGFFGGFTSSNTDPLNVPLFGEYAVLPGTQTPYDFTY